MTPVFQKKPWKSCTLERRCTSVLASIILIRTLCTIHGVSNKFAAQFFTIFCEHVLPSENQMPKNYHATKTLIQQLGLNYNLIHACQVGCVIFKGNMKMPHDVQSAKNHRIKTMVKNTGFGKSLDTFL